MADKGRIISPVSPETVVRDGFTMAPDARSWAITRPIGAADLARIGDRTPASRLLTSHPGITDGLEGSAAAIQTFLSANLPGPEILSVVRDLILNDILLAPLAGIKRGWRYDLIADHLTAWVERLEGFAGGKRLPPNGRRVLINLWLCTVEGRTPNPDRAMVEGFLSTLVNDSGKGRWISGLPPHMVEGAKVASVAFGIATHHRKYSHLQEIVNRTKADPTLSIWHRLHEEFLEQRHLGAVARYELGFRHFICFLVENPQAADVEAFFSHTVERASLTNWLEGRIGSANHRLTILTSLYAFFEWVIAGDDRLSIPDDASDARIARPHIIIPLRKSDLDQAQSADRSQDEDASETVHFALPAEYLDDINNILFAEDMAWPKQRSVDWIDWVDPQTGETKHVYCPVLPNLIGLLLSLPLRHVQARRLDSGEGDAETYDTATKAFVPNYGPHAGYWIQHAVAQPERGALRRIDDSGAKRTLIFLFG